MATATTVVDPALLERRISADRLAPYKLTVGGELSAALDLYQWNAEVSAAFWVVLGHLEILVRNAMHEQLTALSVSRRTGPERQSRLSRCRAARGMLQSRPAVIIGAAGRSRPSASARKGL